MLEHEFALDHIGGGHPSHTFREGGRIESFTGHLANSETIAGALHQPEDPWGRECFYNKNSEDGKRIRQRVLHTKGVFTERELDDSNKSGEAMKYKAKIEALAARRQIPIVDNKRGAGYQSIKAAMKSNDCGVAGIFSGGQ